MLHLHNYAASDQGHEAVFDTKITKYLPLKPGTKAEAPAFFALLYDVWFTTIDPVD